MDNRKIIEINSYIDDMRGILFGELTDFKFYHGLGALELNSVNNDIFSDDNYDDEMLDDSNHKDALDEYKYELAEFFENLKKYDLKKYKFVISLIYHDQFLMLDDDEEKMFEDGISISEEIDDVLVCNPDILYNMTELFLSFNELSYFNKRKIYINTKDKDQYLNNIFPYHYFDKLYFTVFYDENSLIKIFNDYMLLNYNESVLDACNEVINTIQLLYNFDPDNYYNLMKPLLEKYYKHTMYKEKNGKLDEENELLINNIRNCDLEVLLSDLASNSYFLEDIVFELYNDTYVYSDSYKKKVDSLYNEDSNKNVKIKLKKGDV